MARQYVDIKIHEPALKIIDEKNNISYDLKNPAIESIHTTTKLNYAFFLKLILILFKMLFAMKYGNEQAKNMLLEDSPIQNWVLL